MKTPLVNAQQALHDARCDAENAEAVHAKALKNRTEVDALALDPAADLDKSATAVAAAGHKVDIAAGRLRLARERVTACEAAVQQATVAERQTELVDAEAHLAATDDTVLALVREFLSTIAGPLTELLDARDERNALVSQLTALGATANAASPGPSSRALKVGTPDSKTALAMIRAGETVEPAVNPADTVTALVAWIVGEPAREIEAKERAEQVIRNRAAQRHADALAGKLGEEERDAALDAERRGFARFHGRPTDPTLLNSDAYAASAIGHRELVGSEGVP